MTAETMSSIFLLNSRFMLKKLEFPLVGLIVGLTFFFVPFLQNEEFGLTIPWAEKLSVIFRFLPNSFLLPFLIMGGLYVIAGAIPFGAYCLLRKKSNHLFFSFLFFSLGLLMSYIILLFTIFSTFNPTVL